MDELQALRADIKRLEALVGERDQEIKDLEEELEIRELGWNSLDISLHTPSFLLSRQKEGTKWAG